MYDKQKKEEISPARFILLDAAVDPGSSPGAARRGVKSETSTAPSR